MLQKYALPSVDSTRHDVVSQDVSRKVISHPHHSGSQVNGSTFRGPNPDLLAPSFPLSRDTQLIATTQEPELDLQVLIDAIQQLIPPSESLPPKVLSASADESPELDLDILINEVRYMKTPSLSLSHRPLSGPYFSATMGDQNELDWEASTKAVETPKLSSSVFVQDSPHVVGSGSSSPSMSKSFKIDLETLPKEVKSVMHSQRMSNDLASPHLRQSVETTFGKDEV
ncbi:hypothetical protein CVT26_012084 [Gymnopilus dilepis]|uniref:Uncharacterized protein n=1 Tax=Gymnopilus dilepis TaxID=231916 RepID=A0A409W9F2_9AGAR|nr:hypothetical protein CVT26_012084 [Gymnopilus dilepis]